MRPATLAKLDKHDPVAINARAEEVVDYPVTFGGAVMAHYGHHITDGLSRLWHVDDNPCLLTSPLSGFSARLASLGAKRVYMTPERPTLFRKVVVPSSSLLSDGVIYEAHDAEHKRIAEQALKRSGFTPSWTVYLSRSRLGAERRIEGEDEIEAMLSHSGFEIIHPQDLSIEDQIAVFNRADVVVGASGSAMHTSLFHIDKPLRIVTLCGPRFNRRFSLVDQIKSYRSTYIQCLEETSRDGRGVISSQRADLDLVKNGLEMAGVI
ncbi:glycosyltransferase family 61 protein [Brevundimonas sp.]|uniref:glycosyltransferase family 61 protein n=1 Tax=Brevundimonas sp. TaxID=1871086 RepID=UPI003D6D2364